MNYQFVCSECGEHYPSNQPIWRCKCGNYLDLDYMPVLDRSKLTQEKSLWRYSQVLPLEKIDSAISFNEGFTPIISMEFWGINVLAKMDFLMPTGSFKDRGAAIVISRCNELGIKEIVEDSAGNSAAAVASYCAKAKIKAHIYMPAGNSIGKTIQVRTYGARLHLISGTRTDCANAAMECAKRTYFASHGWNPYFLHGTKTVIYEIVEQLGWEVPDYIIVPVGSGSQILGIHLGLKELKNAGIIKKYPKLIAVQSDQCCPLKDFIEGKQLCVNSKNKSIAEGIAIEKPVRMPQIIDAVKDTCGDFITVSDADIIESIKYCASQGIYIEPTSASAVATLKQYEGKFSGKEKIVVLLTGSGLKASPQIAELL